MIEKQLILLALKKILEKYEYEIDKCLRDYTVNPSNCIKDAVKKYKEVIEGLTRGKE